MPLSLLAVGVAVLVFFRMNEGGQFDDDEGPAWSVLMDDDRPPATEERAENASPRPTATATGAASGATATERAAGTSPAGSDTPPADAGATNASAGPRPRDGAT